MSLAVLISIVIPFYNEEECFQDMLGPLVHALESIDYELILVDNGSRDATGDLIDKAIVANHRLKKVRIENNQGYGWGIINGLKMSKGEYIGFMCGDGQISAKDVVKTLLELRDSSCDMVKVHRVKRKDGWVRIFTTRIFNAIVPFLFGLKSRDLNGTPKIFSRKVFGYVDLESKDWFIDVELMIKSEFLGLDIREVPVAFEARKQGTSHVSILKAVLEFIKNVYRFKTGKHYRQWKKSKRLS